MKKFLRIITTIITVCLLSITFTACAGNGNSENTNEQDNYTTHSVNINNEVLFNYYFTTATTSSTSDTTLTISPKLTGFVDYSGYVSFKLYGYSPRIFQSNFDYWGNSSITIPTSSNIEFQFISADIVITYHHEGLSGMPNLSYETVLITKYNYKSYLNVTVNNKRTSTYTNQDGYQYYQTYTVKPVSTRSGCKEFNNVVLIFSNGVSITLDALGETTYKTATYSTEPPIPILSEITGCIDFYPTVIYK